MNFKINKYKVAIFVLFLVSGIFVVEIIRRMYYFLKLFLR